MIIDLRSDTVTKPTKDMLNYMFSVDRSKVGDDVFEEDFYVNTLEEKAARLFGKEAGLFCPSGTMSNQIAIKINTQPLEEIICSDLCHIYNFETGGAAFNSGVSLKLIGGKKGQFKAVDVSNHINPDDVHFPVTSMVAIENTCNKGGGSCWDFSEILKIKETCKEKNLMFHLDGARIFNALIEKKESPLQYGVFDTISVCLSKGLGSPVGSILLSSKTAIKRARRIRKVMGGGMRQTAYMAAAGIYALDNHIERLKEDHHRAKILESELQSLSYVKSVFPVETNIVIFELTESIETHEFISLMEKQAIKVVAYGPGLIRMVIHMGINDEMISHTISSLKNTAIK